MSGLTGNLYWHDFSCVVFMLREMLERDLVSQTEMLQYIGERFRIRLELPMWYTHGQVGLFLLE